MKTDDLICRLAADLPDGPGDAQLRGVGLGRATVLAALITMPLCLMLYGMRAGGAAEDAMGLLFWVAMALAALWSARRLAVPEPAPMLATCGPLAALLAMVALMAGLGQREDVTVFRMDHVLHCAEIIGILAIAPFLWLSIAMRRGAPASPRAAGAMIGLIAGAIGALAYTFSCPIEDSLAALSAHSLSVLLVSALGAAVGPSIFSW
ncbi:MAG: NrsF family protein [Pseudomonadota bacterium]